MSRYVVACSLTFALMLFPASQSAAVGIPVVNVTSVVLSIKNLITDQINRLRSEAIAKTEQKTGIRIHENKTATDTNIAANVSARISDAVADVHNLTVDAESAPYMDACAGVSVARTSASSASDQYYQNKLPQKLSGLTRPDQDPDIKASIGAYRQYQGDKIGVLKDKIRQRIRNWDKQRRETLDRSILDVAGQPAGLNQTYSDTLPDRTKAEKVFYLRKMFLGPGLSDPGPSLLENRTDPDIRARDMVEQGSAMARRSALATTAQIMNHQTSIVDAHYLPVEGAIDASAEPANQERFAVDSTNKPKSMLDHAMLQRIALTKAAKLAAMLRDYRRGQAELLELVLQLTDPSDSAKQG